MDVKAKWKPPQRPRSRTLLARTEGAGAHSEWILPPAAGSSMVPPGSKAGFDSTVGQARVIPRPGTHAFMRTSRMLMKLWTYDP